MEERTGLVTLKGNPMTLVGPELKPGDDAPNVELLTNDLEPFHLSSLKGKVAVLCSVPSLDTSVCDREMRRFNTEAAKVGDDVAVVAISVDLPFAQERWCGAAEADNVLTLSDHRDVAFGTAYGVLMKEVRLLARAIFVVDKAGDIQHVQLVPEVAEDPDYDAALEAVRTLA
jgi:thiol peroxidase